MGKSWIRNVAGIALAPFTAGTSLLGTTYAKNAWNDFTGKSSIEKMNNANIAEAQKNRDWQERMSNTAHQREVADLKAAGINPLLSGQLGGATTPGGAQANVAAEPSTGQGLAQGAGIIASMGSGFSNIAGGLKSLTENKYIEPSTKANIANTVANTALTQAQTAGTEAGTQKTRAETENIREMTKGLQIENFNKDDLLKAEIALKKSQNIEVQQKAIAQAFENAYNKKFGTTMNQTVAERLGSIAFSTFIKYPTKGIDWAIEKTIESINQ